LERNWILCIWLLLIWIWK